MADTLAVKSKSSIVPALAVIGIGCVLFVVAKSMTSGGEVTAAHPLLWVVGALPIAFWSTVPALLRKSFGTRQPFLDGAITNSQNLIWLLSLAVFVILHELHIATIFQTFIYEIVGYRHFAIANLVISAIYIGAGWLTWYGVASMTGQRDSVSTIDLFKAASFLVVNFLWFFTLLYWLPIR